MRNAVVGIGALGLLTTCFLALSLPGADAARAQATGPLPKSLDKLFPPQANGPMYLGSMFAMGSALSGTVADFQEQDFANAEKGYADFRAQYGRVSQLVPEWTASFPKEPMDALGAALKTKDPAQFMPAVDRASQVCQDCHVKNMAAVQQKYEWGDFSGITLTDPVSKGTVPFAVFMQMVDGDLSGVEADLAEGQPGPAHDRAVGLAARFQTLKETCSTCHDSERAYFVDSRVIGMVDQLGAALAGASPDPASARKLVEGIGMESCHKCHLVHVPAAMARLAEQGGK